MFGYSIEDIIFNVFCNLISGFLLIYILYKLYVPKIKISDNIAVKRMSKNQSEYIFKFINLTYYGITDISYDLYKYQKYSLNSVMIYRLRLIGRSLSVPGRRLGVKDKYKENCMQIRTDENIEEILRDESCFLRIKIDITTNISLSGFPRQSFMKEYKGIECLKAGYFKSGESTEILSD